uniref:HAT C-terminal dimerisation domain-containing protein n=1 Tax=Trichogramma kaykai TaxID=54128 RepID=A0ABD2VTM3_9HYME
MCEELCNRLPSNINFYKNLRILSLKVCLSENRPAFVDLLFKKEFMDNDKIGMIERQYFKLLVVDIPSKLKEEEMRDSYKFWCALYRLTNAEGKFIFQEISLYMLKLLSLPSSNAVVERVFSVMNAVKTKARNRMQSVALDSILRVRINFSSSHQCCHKFNPSKKMIKDFNSKIMY